jgi:hypothetical protein
MKTTKLRKKRSTQLLRECWSFLTKLMTCQNLQNKLLNITVLFIWYLLASLKKMSLAKHGELYFILASTCFSPLAILASVWKKWFPTLRSADGKKLHDSLTTLDRHVHTLNILDLVFGFWSYSIKNKVLQTQAMPMQKLVGGIKYKLWSYDSIK